MLIILPEPLITQHLRLLGGFLLTDSRRATTSFAITGRLGISFLVIQTYTKCHFILNKFIIRRRFLGSYRGLLAALWTSTAMGEIAMSILYLPATDCCLIP